jgi:hypothetical protein
MLLNYGSDTALSIKFSYNGRCKRLVDQKNIIENFELDEGALILGNW